MLDVYACRSCEHAQFSETKPISCEKCGGVLSKIDGVRVTRNKETPKYAHELERQRRHDKARRI